LAEIGQNMGIYAFILLLLLVISARNKSALIAWNGVRLLGQTEVHTLRQYARMLRYDMLHVFFITCSLILQTQTLLF
jgi:hypothetical protein